MQGVNFESLIESEFDNYKSIQGVDILNKVLELLKIEGIIECDSTTSKIEFSTKLWTEYSERTGVNNDKGKRKRKVNHLFAN